MPAKAATRSLFGRVSESISNAASSVAKSLRFRGKGNDLLEGPENSSKKSRTTKVTHKGGQRTPFKPVKDEVTAFSDGVDELKQPDQPEDSLRVSHGLNNDGGARAPRVSKSLQKPEHVRQLYKHRGRKNSLMDYGEGRRKEQELLAKRRAYNREIAKPMRRDSLRTQLANVKNPNDVLLLKHEHMHYSSLRDLRTIFDKMDVNGDGVLQADELEDHLQKHSSRFLDSVPENDTAESTSSFNGLGSPRSRSLTRSFGRDRGNGQQVPTIIDESRPPMRLLGTYFKKTRGEMSFKDVLKILYPKATKQELDILNESVRPKTPEEVVEVSEEAQKDAASLFKLMDDDGSGELDLYEFRAVLKEMGMDDVEEMDEFFYEIDVDGGGTISIDEFKEWWFSIGT